MRVLMSPWTFPDVRWEINPHMHIENKPDHEKARLEWSTLLECYLQLGVKVELLRPRPGLHDMVYTANAGWGRKGVFVLSKFRHEERRKEAAFYREWFRSNGFEVIEMPNAQNAPPFFEGQGDLITTNKGYLFGWGQRSSLEAIRYISDNMALGKRRITLRLQDARFYHLDTCLFSWKPLELIMYYPEAFAPEDLKKLERLRLEKIEVTEEEALSFVCNSVYHGTTALLGGASERILSLFRGKNYRVFTVESIRDLAKVFEEYNGPNRKMPTVIALPKPTELMKGGGSYRCCSLFLD